MPQHFRAVALDYDGTLTSTGRLDDTILDALQTLRKERLKLVLVTGRIPWELLELCPHAEELFDRIVWENGAVVWGVRGARVLAPPVPAELEEALARRGVVAAARAGDPRRARAGFRRGPRRDRSPRARGPGREEPAGADARAGGRLEGDRSLRRARRPRHLAPLDARRRRRGERPLPSRRLRAGRRGRQRGPVAQGGRRRRPFPGRKRGARASFSSAPPSSATRRRNRDGSRRSWAPTRTARPRRSRLRASTSS